MKYEGSLFYGVPNWCEICNGGNDDVYHIVIISGLAPDRDEMHICDECLAMVTLK